MHFLPRRKHVEIISPCHVKLRIANRRQKLQSTNQKRKKKQTVREDKKGDRKPKAAVAATKTSRSLSVSQSQWIVKTDGCVEHILETVCDCLQCRNYKLWYDLVCAGMVGKTKSIQDKFLCEQCH